MTVWDRVHTSISNKNTIPFFLFLIYPICLSLGIKFWENTEAKEEELQGLEQI